MLIIDHKNIEEAVSSAELVKAIETAYAIQNTPSTLIPDRMHVSKGDNILLLMPGFTTNSMGTKLVSVFPGNKSKDKPSIYGVFVLNDPETGEPVALINGTKLTAMRTGAVGATAVKHLISAGTKTLGVIGTGVQAYHQALMILETTDFEKFIIGARNVDKAKAIKQQLGQKTDIAIEITTDSNSLVLESDVIVTATSSSVPVFDLKPDKLKDKTIIAIGSYKPDMQELPLSVYEAADNIFVDTMHAKRESGDIKIPMEKGLIKDADIITFNELIKIPELKNNGLNIFKSVGMALFDITCAEVIYHNSKEKGLNTEIEL